MKLNAAVVLVSSFVLFLPGAALALDSIDLSKPAEAVKIGSCSRLVQIKYPFLSCLDGEIGLAGGDATWENSRQIPTMSEWTEGDGVWGPEFQAHHPYFSR